MGFDYSDSWFISAADFKLDTEREKVRVAWVNGVKDNLTDEEIDELYWLLNKFDNEIGTRAWGIVPIMVIRRIVNMVGI